ncbi:glycosyltransferase [Opitutus sp. ER46]|uniref:glycosyltransferase n=1 Tax=Opitutus sp. ER46 TaxID=2161864 RepID=UPI000D3080B6|nr:glycosyltransferase [Opitutus sp. ER46]PTX98385.1 hypothetical protein DB354_03710 [Opitutus sp. ER46]
MRFSIVIPLWKTQYVAETIDSVLAQSCKDYELIIGCSRTDASIENIKKLYSDKARFIDIEGTGIIAHWNNAIKQCRGEFTLLLADDDVLTLDCLAEVSRAIDRNPNCALVQTRIIMFQTGDLVRAVSVGGCEVESMSEYAYNQIVQRRPIIVSCIFFRTSYLAPRGFVDLPDAWGADLFTALTIARLGGVVFVNKPLVKNRECLERVTSNIGWKSRVSAIEMWERMIDCGLLKIGVADDNNMYQNLVESNYKEIYRKARVDSLVACVKNISFKNLRRDLRDIKTLSKGHHFAQAMRAIAKGVALKLL